MRYVSPFRFRDTAGPRALRLCFALVLVGLVANSTMETRAQASRSPQTVIVKMVDKAAGQWRFEPAEVEVHPGDTVRFLLDDVVPHNVEFRKVPRGTDLGDARFGPFLLTKGDTYDVLIDDRFAEGRHEYVCTPHEPMGMKGTITVQPGTYPTVTN